MFSTFGYAHVYRVISYKLRIYQVDLCLVFASFFILTIFFSLFDCEHANINIK